MNFKKIVVILILVLLSLNIYGENNSIEGIYLSQDGYTGLEIISITDTYFVQKVFIKDKMIKTRFEWQRAYLNQYDGDSISFYWMTGRKEDSDKESNGIIVYNLTKTSDGLNGVYFFPRNNNQNRFNVNFKQIISIEP